MDRKNAAKLLLPIFLLAGLDQLPSERDQRKPTEPEKETCPNCGKQFVRVRVNWNFCQATCYRSWLKKQNQTA